MRRRGFWLVVVAATSFLAYSPLRAQETGYLIPRVTPEKPVELRATPKDNPDQVILKFREGSAIRLREDRFVVEDDASSAAASEVDLLEVEDVLRGFRIPANAIERLHTRSESELEAERGIAQRQSGRQLADLNLYYTLSVPPGADVAALCDQLNSLPIVELATPGLRRAPPPIDVPPLTPNFSGMQGYRDAPPGGIGALDPAVVPGGDGAGTTVVDIEYSWQLDHEDLELNASANIDTATLRDFFDSTDHGTAVLGVLGGLINAYGVTGIVPGATLLVAPAETVENLYNLPRAITIATGVLSPGDAILIEQQTGACGGDCEVTQIGCGPPEWDQPVFDAIATATALGIVVVETAGNGNLDLDAASCQGLFDRNVRDSGAIIVGASGDPARRSRRHDSSYGSRVDLQGWGNNVTTTGYGNVTPPFNPEDIRQRYTSSFAGTSSAAPIVTGAALAIQGVVMQAGLAPLDPFELRQILVDTGTPQTGPAENIGPLPNIPDALDAIFGEVAVSVDIRPQQCPNRLPTNWRRFLLPMAILGTADFDVRDINRRSIRLAGVRPRGGLNRLRDVATPFEPFFGKENATDCTRIGADGFEDLLMRFGNRRIVRALRPVSNGQVVVVPVTGELKDGTPIQGEDVIVAVPRRR